VARAFVANVACAMQDIWLTAIFPFTGGDYDGGLSQRFGAQIMLDEINAHRRLLPGYELKVVWQDGKCSKAAGTSAFLKNLFHKQYLAWSPFIPEGQLDTNGDGVITTAETDPYNQLWNTTHVSPDPVGLLGSGCAGTAMNIAHVAYLARWPTISHTATRPALSDRSTYPNFWRTILPDTFFNAAWIAMAKMLGQTSVASVIGETENWGSMGVALASAAQEQGVQLMGFDLTSEMNGFVGLQISIDSTTAASDVVGELRRLKPRIVILLMFQVRNRLVLCEAYRQGYVNAIYMPMGWLPNGWWTGTDAGCTAAQITSMATGFISANMMFWRGEMSTRLSCAETMTAEGFRTEWFRRQGKEVGDMSNSADGYFLTAEGAVTADAVCMYAQMLHEMLVVRRRPLVDLAARTSAAYSEIQEVLAATDFQGVQGRLRYGPNEADPKGSIIMQHLQNHNGTGVIVDIGSYTDGVFDFFGTSQLIFQFPGEVFQTGPPGATSISAVVDSFKNCAAEKLLNMSTNTCESPSADRVFIKSTETFVCRPGYYSPTPSSPCALCKAGTFTPQPGMIECRNCSKGAFANNSGAASCTFCPRGRFTGVEGTSLCEECKRGFSTADIAQTDSASCVCKEGQYNDGGVCLDCKTGMVCRIGSDIGNYKYMGSGASIQDHPYPTLQPRRWSSLSEPLSIFDCENEDKCPGGDPGQCASELVGQACVLCKEGWRWNGESCEECGSAGVTRLVFPVIPCVLLFVGICVLYRFTGDPVERWGSWQNGCMSIIFVCLVHYQIVNLVGRANLVPPTEINTASTLWKFSNDVLSLFSMDCAGFASFHSAFVCKVVGPIFMVVCFVVVWLVSRVASAIGAGRYSLQLNPLRLFNVYMSMIFTFFSAISSLSLSLFKCVDNPNGKMTLAADRSIVCWSSDDWLSMLAFGIFAVLVYVLGCGCVYAYVIIVAPTKFKGESYRVAWKFLFLKYRCECWWWSAVFLAKMFLVNMAFVIFSPAVAQLYWIMAANVAYQCAVCFVMPYRHFLVNILEVIVSVSITFSASVLTWFADHDDGKHARALSITSMLISFIPLLLGAVFIACLLEGSELCCQGIMTGESPEERVQRIIKNIRRLAQLSIDDFRQFLSGIGEMDRRMLVTLTNIISVETEGIGGWRMLRITDRSLSKLFEGIEPKAQAWSEDEKPKADTFTDDDWETPEGVTPKIFTNHGVVGYRLSPRGMSSPAVVAPRFNDL